MLTKTVISFLTIASLLAPYVQAENWDNILDDGAIDTSGWINPNDMGFGPTPTKNVQKPVLKVFSKPEKEEPQDEVSQAGDSSPAIPNIRIEIEKSTSSSGTKSFYSFNAKIFLNVKICRIFKFHYFG